MWPASCRTQGMLIQGYAPDPKCKSIISSFVTLPNLLDCLICSRNARNIHCIVITNDRGWDRWGVVYYIRVCEGQGMDIVL